MAASLKTAGRPARPLGAACHWSSGSSQTISEPRRLSEALYAGQFVVRYRARGGLLIASGYQDRVLAGTWPRSYATTPSGAHRPGIDRNLLQQVGDEFSSVLVHVEALSDVRRFFQTCG